MKYLFADGTSIEVSSTDEPEMYSLLKELVKAQTDKIKAETAKINLETEVTKCKQMRTVLQEGVGNALVNV